MCTAGLGSFHRVAAQNASPWPHPPQLFIALVCCIRGMSSSRQDTGWGHWACAGEGTLRRLSTHPAYRTVCAYGKEPAPGVFQLQGWDMYVCLHSLASNCTASGHIVFATAAWQFPPALLHGRNLVSCCCSLSVALQVVGGVVVAPALQGTFSRLNTPIATGAM